MMKRSERIGVACLVLLVLYSGSSIAASKNPSKGFYVKAGVGVMKHLRFKETDGMFIRRAPEGTPVYKFGVGYRFNKSVRADLEIRYAGLTYKHDDTRQKMHTTAGFLNGYYDINFHEKLVPYIVAGIGLGCNRAGAFRGSDELMARGRCQENFVWNVGAGAQFNFNKNYSVGLDYRYVDLGSIHTRDAGLFKGGNQRIRGHQIVGSLTYSF
jgi:opacity protein-like surface antigen